MTDFIDHLIAKEEYDALKDRAAKLDFKLEEKSQYVNVVDTLSHEMPNIAFYSFIELRSFLNGVEFQRWLQRND